MKMLNAHEPMMFPNARSGAPARPIEPMFVTSSGMLVIVASMSSPTQACPQLNFSPMASALLVSDRPAKNTMMQPARNSANRNAGDAAPVNNLVNVKLNSSPSM